jgi:hypothetical protein
VVAAFDSLEAARQFKATGPVVMKAGTQAEFVIRQTNDPSVVYVATAMPGPNEAVVYVNGQAVRIQINDDLLARAYNNIGAEAMGPIFKAGQSLNRFLSTIYTGYSPEFILVNVKRDFTAGIMNITGTKGITFAGTAIKNYAPMFADLLRYGATGTEGRWIKMYRENGGNTGAAYLSDLERLGADLLTQYATYRGVTANLAEGNLRIAARAAGRKAFSVTLRPIELINMAGENAMRLAVFKTSIERGESPAAAASLAKNVTVNFNRKGEWGSNLNASFLFFNAAVQGTASVVKPLFKGEHKYQGRALAAGLASLGFIMAAFMGAEDEEEYEKLPDYVKGRNMVIKVGDQWATVAVPYGQGFFWNMGRIVADGQRTGDWSKSGWHLATSFITEMTPFGSAVAGDELRGENALYLLPTALQILGAPIVNQNSFGSEMMPVRGFDKHKPDTDLAWRSTEGTWPDILAKELFHVGIEISPETIKHLTRTFTGGAGTFVSSTVDAAVLKTQGASMETSEIPFKRKFVRKTNVRDSRSTYWTAKTKIDKAVSELKRAVDTKDFTLRDAIRNEKRDLLAMENLAETYQDMADAKRTRAEKIRLSTTLSTAERRRRIKEIEKQEEEILDRFMRIFRERTRD